MRTRPATATDSSTQHRRRRRRTKTGTPDTCGDSQRHPPAGPIPQLEITALKQICRTYFRVCDGVRVRFADTKAPSDVTVLLLAPWPESLWAFRRIWNRVAAVARVVA